jgi:hypothetical protein
MFGLLGNRTFFENFGFVLMASCLWLRAYESQRYSSSPLSPPGQIGDIPGPRGFYRLLGPSCPSSVLVGHSVSPFTSCVLLGYTNETGDGLLKLWMKPAGGNGWFSLDVLAIPLAIIAISIQLLIATCDSERFEPTTVREGFEPSVPF